MMCQRMGRFPTGTIGLGRSSVSSRMRVPRPPQRTKTGTSELFLVIKLCPSENGLGQTWICAAGPEAEQRHRLRRDQAREREDVACRIDQWISAGDDS